MSTQARWSNLALNSLRFSNARSIKLVMQNEVNECGMACLCMIADYHGKGLNLSDLRLSLNDDGKGVSLKGIIEQASLIDLSSRALQLSLSELNQLQCPAILHWNFSHFVVLTKVNKNGIYIADPARASALSP